MNSDQWIELLSKAYQSSGASFSDLKREFLLADFSEDPSESENEMLAEAYDVIFALVFKTATSGQTFGDTERIRDKFGMSLEENYGLSNGPFLDLAKAYWTFKIEIHDVPGTIALFQILKKEVRPPRTSFIKTN